MVLFLLWEVLSFSQYDYALEALIAWSEDAVFHFRGKSKNIGETE
jgi:hypothetical protein